MTIAEKPQLPTVHFDTHNEMTIICMLRSLCSAECPCCKSQVNYRLTQKKENRYSFPHDVRCSSCDWGYEEPKMRFADTFSRDGVHMMVDEVFLDRVIFHAPADPQQKRITISMEEASNYDYLSFKSRMEAAGDRHRPKVEMN
jgi:hypothetical protein